MAILATPAPARRAPAAPPSTAPTSTEPVVTDPERAWKLYDETTATAAIVDAIQGAKHVVNAEFFGVSDAGKGARLTSALEAAAQRGVEVNVIADFTSTVVPPFGSFQRFARKVRRAGGSVVVNSRIPFAPRVREFPGLRHVDHRKVVTVDGTTAFVGGMNFVKLTDGYHDSMVGITGVAAARLAAGQLDRWRRVGGAVTQAHEETVSRALAGAADRSDAPTDLRAVMNAPDQGRFDISDGYLELIRGAKRRLWIASPAIADRSVAKEVAAAARRGVDVRVVTGGKPALGVPVIQWLSRSHLAKLEAAGAQGFEIPEVLHRKAIVADDEVILSSYNLTKRSRVHDHESGIRTTDPDFVEAIADILRGDFARSTPFAPERHTGLGRIVGDLAAEHITY